MTTRREEGRLASDSPSQHWRKDKARAFRRREREPRGGVMSLPNWGNSTLTDANSTAKQYCSRTEIQSAPAAGKQPA